MLKAIKADDAAAWSPESWRDKQALQLPYYADLSVLSIVTDSLKASPPLIAADETRRLKSSLAKVADGESFLLQAGDCAESFAEFHPLNIRSTFDVIRQMAQVITATAGMPVVKVGRIAGQFAKPRSDSNETHNGITLPSYKGDIINGIEFTPETRRPEPERMLQAYKQCATTLNLLRGFTQQTRTDFFTAHEALLLPYEQALTRIDKTTNTWYDTSAHFLWVGDRTRQIDSAHVEFLRGIGNPIGIKCGPTLPAEELLALLDILNPANEPGRITLISRMGHHDISGILPPFLRTIKAEGRIVSWACDPMHGNTTTSSTGYKTREFAHILSEVKKYFASHHAEGTHPGGIHLELVGRDVTECTGGKVKITEDKLSERYQTHCDPRLNASQGLELATLIADELRTHYKAKG